MNDHDPISGGSYRIQADGSVTLAECTGERPCKCRPADPPAAATVPAAADAAPASDAAALSADDETPFTPLSRRRARSPQE